MDATAVAFLREVLASTGWVERTREFSRRLRATKEPGGLLLLGVPDDEPWHLAAHLDDESRLNQLPQLTPTLVRWSPPPDAPPHLGVGLDRIRATGRGETLFVVTAEPAPPRLLERVDDARGSGATVLALDGGDKELEQLAHDAISVPSQEPLVTFDGVQHLVTVAAGERDWRRRGLRDRLAQLLAAVSGPPHGD